MPEEITIKDIWSQQEKNRTEFIAEIKELRLKIEAVSTAFHTFEAGRVTQLIQDVAILKTERDNLVKKDEGFDKDAEKRKEWIWGAFEKVLFIVVGLVMTVIGVVLSKLNILN